MTIRAHGNLCVLNVKGLGPLIKLLLFVMSSVNCRVFNLVYIVNLFVFFCINRITVIRETCGEFTRTILYIDSCMPNHVKSINS